MVTADSRVITALQPRQLAISKVMADIPLRLLLVIFKYCSLDTQLQAVCKFWLKAKSCLCAPKILHNIHLLATGTFSNVYGINILKTRYALKRMEKVTQANLQNIRRVRREVKAHSVCYHPHVIQLYHIYQDANSLFMVEEYAPYGDLFDFSINRNNRTLPEESILSIFFQVASAVTYLHQSNIVFRDLRLEYALWSTRIVRSRNAMRQGLLPTYRLVGIGYSSLRIECRSLAIFLRE